jgi:hypothetical protein
MELAHDIQLWPGWGFWSILIGIVIGAVGFWAARRYGDSGRRLFYQLGGTTPLLKRVEAAIQVAHRGQPLQNPVVATLIVDAPNRRDINEADFSKGRPLTFVFHCPIIEVLDMYYAPEDCPTPSVRSDGRELMIGPDPLHAKSRLTISLLFDEIPTVGVPIRTLNDIQIAQGEPRAREWARFSRFLLPMAAVAAAPVVAEATSLNLAVRTTITITIFCMTLAGFRSFYANWWGEWDGSSQKNAK